MKTSNATHAQRFEMAIALGLTLLLVALHLILLLNRGPLWRDEISSLALATQPTMGGFWASLALDPCPPFFFLLLRFWHALVGDSDFALRILGCAIGLACVGAFWFNARLTGRKTPTISFLLLGFSPTLIVWGDSLRGYGVGVFWIVIASALFWKFIERPTAWMFAATTGGAILAVHSLYTNSLLIFACGSAAAIVAARRKNWRTSGLVLLAGVIAAVSLLPYWPLLRQTTEWAGLMRVDYSLGYSFRMLRAALAGPLVWVWILLLTLAVITAIGLQRRKMFAELRDSALYALLSALIGFVGTMAFFRAVGWGTNVWYYLPMLAVMAVAIDSIFDFRALVSPIPLARTVATLGFLALSFPSLREAVETRASNMDLAVLLISKRAAPEDLVIVWPAADLATFQRYLRRPLNWISVPKVPHSPARPGDDILAPYRERDAIRPVFERIRATLQAGHDVWVASSWPLRVPPIAPPPVRPLNEANPQSVGYFLWGWGSMMSYNFALHGEHLYQVELPLDQPVNKFETCRILRVSGWKEAAATR